MASDYLRRGARDRRSDHGEAREVRRAPVDETHGWPGKRALTDHLQGPSPHPSPVRQATRVDGSELVATVRDALAELTGATTALDAAAAAVSAIRLEGALAVARIHAAALEVSHQIELRRLTIDAQPALAGAPAFPPVPHFGVDRAAWALVKAAWEQRQASASTDAGDGHAIDDRPLPADLRGDLERATGASLAEVRVHAGSRGATIASSHSARGVADGSEIFLARGEYAPTTPEGRELIAHEVAHVLQARQASPARPTSIADAEREADDFAAAFRSRGGGASFRAQHAATGPMRKLTAGSGSTTPTPAPLAAPSDATRRALWRFIRTQSQAIANAVTTMLTDNVRAWPAPSPRLAWAPGAGFSLRLVRTLRPVIADDPAAIYRFVSEAAIEALYQQYVVPLVASRTEAFPDFEQAIGALFESGIVASIQALGPQLDAMVARQLPLDADHLMMSRGLDRYVGPAMARPGCSSSGPAMRRCRPWIRARPGLAVSSSPRRSSCAPRPARSTPQAGTAIPAPRSRSRSSGGSAAT
jgi:hypothetical protein